MTYHPMGISSDDWCSTDNNRCQGSTPVPNICLPMTASALSAVKQLQRDTNRLRKQRGNSLIDVDGRVGPQTRAAVENELKAVAVGMTPLVYCDNVMSNLSNIAAAIASAASAAGAPVVADPRPKTPPSQPRPDGRVAHPPPGAMRAGIDPLTIAVLGVVGYLIYRGSK